MMFTFSYTRRALAALVVSVALAGPAAAQVSLLSNTVEEHTANPGDRYSGTIVVANPTNAPQVLRLYQTDYRFAADGTSDFDAPGSLARSNAAWVTLQTTRITVPANAQLSVSYGVAVPASDSLRGTYWSTIMVEGVPSQDPSDAAPHHVGVSAVMRYAVQVATHVGNSGSHAIKFERAGATREAADARFDLDVANTGERAYRPVLWIEVYDTTGSLRAKARQTRGLVYPGSSFHQHFDLGTLPAGTYKAVVFADTGDTAVSASQFNITY